MSKQMRILGGRTLGDFQGKVTYVGVLTSIKKLLNISAHVVGFLMILLSSESSKLRPNLKIAVSLYKYPLKCNDFSNTKVCSKSKS